MSTIGALNRKLLGTHFPQQLPYGGMLSHYRGVAESYAQIEQAIAVLSDMHTNKSYIYYGAFASTLGISQTDHPCQTASIWERHILDLIHPDDLHDKYLGELCFYHFVKRRPMAQRHHYYLQSQLRMRDASGCYIPVVHRMYYIYADSVPQPWLALCLYSPQACAMPSLCMAIDSVTGRTHTLSHSDGESILSDREKEVLTLIDRGLASKEIAASLFISVHTVSRHRQSILAKLQVANSVEACRVARDLGII